MTRTVFTGCLLLMIISSAFGIENYISEKNGFFVVVPSGWGIDTSAANEAVLVDSSNNSIYVSIRKYRIEEDKQIGSEHDLLQAISGLYRNLGIKVDSLNQINYTVSDGKAVFETEFGGYDAVGRTTHRKYLKGTICRNKDNGQTLYLMIAAAPKDYYDIASPQFKIVAKSFHITDEILPNLYPKPNFTKFLLIFIVIALCIFFFTRNRKIQRSHHPLGRDSASFWRCIACGRANHIDVRFCHRCGVERPVANLPRMSGHSSTSSISTPEHDKG